MKLSVHSLLSFTLCLLLSSSPSITKAENIFDSCCHAAKAVGAGAASFAGAGLTNYFLNNAHHYLRRTVSADNRDHTRQYTLNSVTAATLAALTSYGTYTLAKKSYQSATKSTTTALLTGLAAYYGYDLAKKQLKKHGIVINISPSIITSK